MHLNLYRYYTPSFLFLFFLSSKYGWFFQRHSLWAVNSNIAIYLLGLKRLYKLCFRLKGFGFRFFVVKKSVYVKLDFTHKVSMVPLTSHKIYYRNRYKIKIFGRNMLDLRNSFSFFLYFICKKVFKKLGIFLKGIVHKIKLSKKKAKY